MLFPAKKNGPKHYRSEGTDICLHCPLSDVDCFGGQSCASDVQEMVNPPGCPYDFALYHGIDLAYAELLARQTLGREMNLEAYQSTIRQTVERREMLEKVRGNQ